jgi:hypothetical protein
MSSMLLDMVVNEAEVAAFSGSCESAIIPLILT